MGKIVTPKQDSIVDEEENQSSHSQFSPTPIDFEQTEALIGHQLNVMKNEFVPNLKALGDEFESERNRVKRETYKASHTLEQKKEVLTKWQEFMKEISAEIPFFAYFENHFKWHRKSCVLTKTNWTKENQQVVQSSQPPLETIVIKHQGQKVVAYPFKKPIEEEKPVRKLMEQNNYTNWCLDVIGKQLDKIEDTVENKVIP